MPGGVRTEVHLDSAATAGAFCLLVDHPPGGWSLPPHRHREESETIHIVEGAFEMEIDGHRSRISAGHTIHVPRGMVHSGSNLDGATGRRIVVFSPGGMERFFLEAGAPTADAEFDIDAVLASATHHGWEFIAPQRHAT
jgi:quercetin dioxygenase-like cupin family protein